MRNAVERQNARQVIGWMLNRAEAHANKGEKAQAWKFLKKAEHLADRTGWDIDTRVHVIQKKLLDIPKIQAEVRQYFDGARVQAELGHGQQMENLLGLAWQRARLIDMPIEHLIEEIRPSLKFGTRLCIPMALAVA